MNIAYIGSKDALSYQFIQHMCREEDEIYFLSNEDFSQKKSSSFQYKFFKLTHNEEVLNNVLSSIQPEVIVFSGYGYMDELWLTGGDRYFALLHNILEFCTKNNVKKFIYLSSVEVYGTHSEPITEDTVIAPVTNKGIQCAQGEYMVSLYHQRDHLPVSILRASQIYSNECSWNSYDFLSNIFKNITQDETFICTQDEVLYPLHASDFAEGIKRTIESVENTIFNITGSFPIKKTEIYCLAAASMGIQFIPPQNIQVAEQGYNTEKIQKRLEWIDFKTLNELFAENRITYGVEQKHAPEKKQNISQKARKTIENVVVFSVFYGLYLLCMSHNLFSKIDWLLIYVTVTSLFLGIGQSALSVVLASGGFLLSQNLSILEMNNFYSYAESVLAIVQFIFFGICISYTTDQLKEKIAEYKRREELITEEYQELKNINQQNVYIKNEYEKRLLESKTSMPQLYDIVKTIMVLSPDRIFMEVIEVVAKVIKTNTVAIYIKNTGSTYLRLINSLNENSVVEGKSWNIASSPQILNAIEKNEIYQGNTFVNEPAVIVPISQSSKGLAILVIKDLPYAQQTLYQMNVLTTLLSLVRDAIDKAFAYEKETMSRRYVADSTILILEEFRKSVSLAKEKREKGLADYCILSFDENEDAKVIYTKIENMFRVTDSFGIGSHGELYLLLNNTNEQDAHYILKRMKDRGVNAAVCTQTFVGG